MCRLAFISLLLCTKLVSAFLPSITIRIQITASDGNIIRTNKRFQEHCPFSVQQLSLYSRKNNEDNEEPERGKDGGNVFEKIWESPYFSSVLFWLPFIANERLRKRAANFVSEHVDLNIAIPLSAAGVMGAVLYVSYQNKLTEIERARFATNESIRKLREIRKLQMTGGGGGESVESEYQNELETYESMLREELNLRKSLEMFPLKIPNKIEGPDKAAAKQFLKMEINESGDLVP